MKIGPSGAGAVRPAGGMTMAAKTGVAKPGSLVKLTLTGDPQIAKNKTLAVACAKLKKEGRGTRNG